MATVHFTIDPQQDVKAISQYIYGVNESLQGPYAHNTLQRLGGNRWTAYNWENNASNAGSDYFYQNDDYLGGGNTPGGALIPGLQNSSDHQAGTLVTIPINGYVSADKLGGGDVRNSGPDYLDTRFHQEVARKGSAFSLTPNTGDDKVYADEFVNWIKTKYPYGQSDPNRPIFFSLDNEPDLWMYTHEEVHPNPVTYSELMQKTIAYASAIKDVAPNANVFGPANYGFTGYVNLQFAPDANGRDFQEYYLQQLKQAETTYGHRLVDTLDVHWYPEAQGGGVRITGDETSPAVVAARLQAPRSLWDSTYTEDSWITDYLGGPVSLLPMLQGKIDANYPGTKLAVTEYNYGGGQHISGGIAEADVLGIFGRDGVFAANEWRLQDNESFIGGAFQMYRNFNGQGGKFGDLSVLGSTDDAAASSIYASIDSSNHNVMTLVAINKTGSSLPALLNLAHVPAGATADVYRLTSGSSNPVHVGQQTIGNPGSFNYSMPGYSVSTIRITWANNSPPVIAALGPGVTYTENAAPLLVAASATLTDVDTGNFAGGKLTASLSAGAGGADRLVIKPAGSVSTSGGQVLYAGQAIGTFTGGNGATPLVISWNSLATPAKAQSVLRHLAYENLSDNPATQVRTLSLQETDGAGGTSATVSKQIHLTAVNDKPVLTLSGSIGYVRGAPAVVLASTATLNDVDSPNFDGGVLRVRIAVGDSAGTTLGIGTGFTVDAAGNIRQGTTLIGARTSNGVGANELKITLNSNATKSVVQALVRSLTYRNVGGTAGQRKIEFTLSDGDGGTSDVQTKTVNVT